LLFTMNRNKAFLLLKVTLKASMLRFFSIHDQMNI
jgi:hypothetical protein